MVVRALFLVGRDAAHPAAGGGDVQAFTWARWMAQQGHDVTLVCQAHPDLARSELVEGVKVERLGRGAPLMWKAARYFWKRRSDFDLVYEDPIGGGRLPYLSPLYVRRPTVAVWHQVSQDLFHSLHSWPVATAMSLVERFVAIIYRRCWFWAPSQESADAVIEQLGFPRERVAIVSPTVDESLLRTHVEAVSDAHVLQIGVIRRYKAPDHLIRAMSLVVKQVPDACATIAGRTMDKEFEYELRRLVDELGLTDIVAFRTDVSEDEKWELLARSRALALPSQLEGFGIVSIEANCAGVPVVASSGVPLAAVEDGANGLRFDYGDVSGLADRLVQILLDERLYRRLSEGALHAARLRTPEVVGQRFARLVQAALAGTPVPLELRSPIALSPESERSGVDEHAAVSSQTHDGQPQ